MTHTFSRSSPGQSGTLKVPRFEYEKEDDEQLIIKMNGIVIAVLDHDRHGWDGMKAVEDAVRNIEKELQAESRKVDLEDNS